MSGYQPTNPYLPYGNMRSSKTGSRAVAGMAPQPAYPDFSGIGSLPSAPAPLQGGLGKVMAGGRDLGELIMRQTGRDGTHGRVEMPRVNTQPDVREHVEGGGLLNRAIDRSLRNPVPAFEGGQMMNIDPRSGYDPMAIMQASRAVNQGVNPQSEEYAQMLLGHPAQPQAMQQLPEEMTAQALPMDAMQGQPPFQPDASGFQMREPQMDEMSAMQLPADLENPFQDVANQASAPRSLTREDDLNNGFDPQDPYQQYAMPQYSNQGDPFYKGVNNVAMDGLDNKQRFDKMRWADWNRDNTERGWDEFAGSILTPLGAAFAKDPNVRARMQQSAQGQLGRYNQQRQLRDSERGQQFNEDKYYTDMRQANDPNSYPNWIEGQNARTGRINAATGVRNAQSLYDNRNSLIDNRSDEHDRKVAWDNWKMQNGNTIESRRLFESMYKQNQGQQRIDNQQNQFTQKQSQQDAQFQRAQALRESTAQQQIAESQSRLAKAARSGNEKKVDQELRRLELILKANQRDKDGNYIYPDFAAAQVGAIREPEQEPITKQNIIDQLSSALGLKAKASEQTDAPEPAGKPKKSITAGLSKTELRDFDQKNAKHRALAEEAHRIFGDNVTQAKAWLKAKGYRL